MTPTARRPASARSLRQAVHVGGVPWSGLGNEIPACRDLTHRVVWEVNSTHAGQPKPLVYAHLRQRLTESRITLDEPELNELVTAISADDMSGRSRPGRAAPNIPDPGSGLAPEPTADKPLDPIVSDPPAPEPYDPPKSPDDPPAG